MKKNERYKMKKKMLVSGQGNLSQLYFIIAMWMIKEKAKPEPIDTQVQGSRIP